MTERSAGAHACPDTELNARLRTSSAIRMPVSAKRYPYMALAVAIWSAAWCIADIATGEPCSDAIAPSTSYLHRLIMAVRWFLLRRSSLRSESSLALSIFLER